MNRIYLWIVLMISGILFIIVGHFLDLYGFPFNWTGEFIIVFITLLGAYAIFSFEQKTNEENKIKKQKQIMQNLLIELNNNAQHWLGYSKLFKRFIKNNESYFKGICKKTNIISNEQALFDYDLSDISFGVRNSKILHDLLEYHGERRNKLNKKDIIRSSIAFYNMEEMAIRNFISESDAKYNNVINSIYKIMKLNSLFKFQNKELLDLLIEHSRIKDKHEKLNNGDKIVLDLVIHHNLSIYGYLEEYYNSLTQLTYTLIFEKVIKPDDLIKFPYLKQLYQDRLKNT